jgi:hypothetical protein
MGAYQIPATSAQRCPHPSPPRYRMGGDLSDAAILNVGASAWRHFTCCSKAHSAIVNNFPGQHWLKTEIHLLRKRMWTSLRWYDYIKSLLL